MPAKRDQMRKGSVLAQGFIVSERPAAFCEWRLWFLGEGRAGELREKRERPVIGAWRDRTAACAQTHACRYGFAAQHPLAFLTAAASGRRQRLRSELFQRLD